MVQRVQAHASRAFSLSPQQFYDAWLRPEKVRRWMSHALQTSGLSGEMREVQIEPSVGGKFLFSDLRNGNEARHWGSYLELSAPDRISFTWIVDEAEEEDPSIVRLSIAPQGSGCVASIVHEMDVAWAEYLPQTEKGWTRMLDAIASTEE